MNKFGFVAITNRGAQLGPFSTKSEAQSEADRINRVGGNVFAWVIEADANTEQEDMPGRGFVYG